MTVYFIGSGPGDPELMTLKGQRLLDASTRGAVCRVIDTR